MDLVQLPLHHAAAFLVVLSATVSPILGCTPSERSQAGADTGVKADTKDVAAPEVPWTVESFEIADNLSAVASFGSDIYIASQAGRLLKSSDRGAHFAAIPVGPAMFLSLSGTAADDVWVAGRAGDDQGLLLHSSDGGISWQEQRNNLAGELYGVWAVDREHVFAAGPRGIAATSDGGRRWSLAYADPALFFTALWASGLDDIYVAGGTMSSTSALDAGDDADGGRRASDVSPWWGGVLLHSADGGVSWKKVVSDAGCTLQAVSGSPDGRVVYAVGDFDTRAWTTDHGATWDRVSQAGGVPTSMSDPDNPNATNMGVWVSPTARIHVLRPRRVEIFDPSLIPHNEDLPALTIEAGLSSWGSAIAIRGTSDDDVWVVGAVGFHWHKHRSSP